MDTDYIIRDKPPASSRPSRIYPECRAYETMSTSRIAMSTSRNAMSPPRISICLLRELRHPRQGLVLLTTTTAIPTLGPSITKCYTPSSSGYRFPCTPPPYCVVIVASRPLATISLTLGVFVSPKVTPRLVEGRPTSTTYHRTRKGRLTSTACYRTHKRTTNVHNSF